MYVILDIDLNLIFCKLSIQYIIYQAFSTYEKQKNGKYVIRLYDARIKDIKHRKRKIVIDDYIPCDKDTKQPIFSSPNGNEMWVLLLEKAFAS